MSDDTSQKTERRSPETLRLRMITPSLTVDDLEASIAWYRDVVGFTVKDLWKGDGKVMGAELVAGASMLILGQDDFAKGRDREKGTAMRLYMTTSQSVDDVAEAIKARGGTLESEPADMPWGGRAFTLVDPDGFRITVAGD